MTVKPIYNNILIKPIDSEKATTSGIIIPDTAQEKPLLGEVVEVGFGNMGDDGKITPLYVEKGQKVLYKKWGGNEVKVEGQDWLIIEERDILAVIYE